MYVQERKKLEFYCKNNAKTDNGTTPTNTDTTDEYNLKAEENLTN